MGGSWNEPQLFRFARRRVKRLGMLGRNHSVDQAVDDEDRHRADPTDRLQRLVLVVDGQRERPLQRPGKPEPGQLLACNPAIAGKGTLGHQRLNTVPIRRPGQRRDGYGATQALPEDHDPVGIDLRDGEDRTQGGLGVQMQAGQAGLARRAAVAPIIEEEDVVALLRQPPDAGEMGADVLRIAVQKEHCACHATHRVRVSRQKPAVKSRAVGRLEPNVAVGEPHAVRGEHELALRMEQQARTGAKVKRDKQEEHAGERPHRQKYQFSDSPTSKKGSSASPIKALLRRSASERVSVKRCSNRAST